MTIFAARTVTKSTQRGEGGWRWVGAARATAEQAPCPGGAGRLDAVLRAQLRHRRLHVRLHGALDEAERVGDLDVRRALLGQPQHLHLAPTQRVGAGRAPRVLPGQPREHGLQASPRARVGGQVRHLPELAREVVRVVGRLRGPQADRPHPLLGGRDSAEVGGEAREHGPRSVDDGQAEPLAAPVAQVDDRRRLPPLDPHRDAHHRLEPLGGHPSVVPVRDRGRARVAAHCRRPTGGQRLAAQALPLTDPQLVQRRGQRAPQLGDGEVLPAAHQTAHDQRQAGHAAQVVESSREDLLRGQVVGHRAPPVSPVTVATRDRSRHALPPFEGTNGSTPRPPHSERSRYRWTLPLGVFGSASSTWIRRG